MHYSETYVYRSLASSQGKVNLSILLILVITAVFPYSPL